MWLIVKQLTIKVDGWDASLALRDQPKESASFAFACIKLLLIIISWEITRGKLHDFNDNLIITPQKKQNPEVKRQQSYTVYPTKYVLIYVIAVHINNRPLFTGTRIAHPGQWTASEKRHPPELHHRAGGNPERPPPARQKASRCSRSHPEIVQRKGKKWRMTFWTQQNQMLIWKIIQT